MIIEEHKGMQIFRNGSESTSPRNIKMIMINSDNLPNFLCIYKGVTFEPFNDNPTKANEKEYYYIFLDERDEYGLKFDNIEIAKWYFEELSNNHPLDFKTKEAIETSRPSFFI